MLQSQDSIYRFSNPLNWRNYKRAFDVGQAQTRVVVTCKLDLTSFLIGFSLISD
jgi:hypothetical protein